MQAVRRFAPLVVILLLAAGLYFSGVGKYLTPESLLGTLRSHAQALQAVVAAHPVTSVLVYIAIYALICAACLPFNLIATLTGGLLFGTWLGGAATMAACTIGSLGAYFAAHSAFGKPLLRLAERRGGTLQKIIKGFGKNAFSYVISLRLVPVFPFWFVSLAAGIASPPLWAFVLGTAVGIIPACFIYAGLGAGLGKAFASGEPVSMSTILAPHIVLPLAGLAVLSLLPVALARLRKAKA